MLNDLVENGDGNAIDKIKEIIKKKSKLSVRKLAKILNASKSTICNLRNKNSNEENNHNELNVQIRQDIAKAFKENKGRLGRRTIREIILRTHQYNISARQVGRLMNEMVLFCNIRKAVKFLKLKILQLKWMIL